MEPGSVLETGPVSGLASVQESEPVLEQVLVQASVRASVPVWEKELLLQLALELDLLLCTITSTLVLLLASPIPSTTGIIILYR